MEAAAGLRRRAALAARQRRAGRLAVRQPHAAGCWRRSSPAGSACGWPGRRPGAGASGRRRSPGPRSALTGDSFTPPLRQFSGGLSEPLAACLVLGAILSALARRPVARALARGRRRPAAPRGLAVPRGLGRSGDAPRAASPPGAGRRALLVPLAWFVPDLIGAGNPLEGPGRPAAAGSSSGRCRGGRAGPGRAARRDLGRRRPRSSPECRRSAASASFSILLAGALAWVGVVAAMAVGGFAGLPRFLAPATAVFAVLGAAGLARAAVRAFARWPSPAAVRRPRAGSRHWSPWPWSPPCAGFGLRAAQLPGDLRTVRDQADSIELALRARRRHRPRAPALLRRARADHPAARQTAARLEAGEPIENVRAVAGRDGVVVSTGDSAGGDRPRRPVAATQLPCQGAAVGSSTSGRASPVSPAPPGTAARLALAARGRRCPR